MSKNEVLNYFESEAKKGVWDELYNPGNPASYSFINRVNKSTSLIKDISNQKVLDLGCGTGAIIPFVLNKKAHYCGIDNSQEMLNIIKKKFANDIDENKVTLELNSFLSFTNSVKFDIIIGLGFIEYFNDYEKIFENIDVTLKGKGQLILSFPNNASFDTFMVKLLYIPKLLASIFTGKKTIQPPRKLWNSRLAKDVFKKYGYKNILIINYNTNLLVYPFTRFFPKFSNSIAKILDNTFLAKINFFSSGFIVSGNK